MVITFYGQSCFKIETQGLTIVIDPYGKDTGLPPPRCKADVVFITHEHRDHNYREPFADAAVIEGPGEYDLKGIAAKGILAWHDATSGKERGATTIYRIEAEGLVLAHTGDFGQQDLATDQRENLGGIDVLFIPVGGTSTIDAETAARLTNHVEPKIVIPMHYALPKLTVKLEPVERFLKEIGQKPVPVAKLTIKKKDLGEQGTKVVVLTPPGMANGV